MKIIIKTLAKTNAKNITNVSHVVCGEDFVEYMKNEELLSKLERGYMKFIIESNHLYTIVEYVPKPDAIFTLADINLIGEYTRGQLTDGIGESFEQECVREDDEGGEIYISPYAGWALNVLIQN
jgi:hypothetical protein